MKKRVLAGLLGALFLLTGCGERTEAAVTASAGAEIEEPKYVALTFDDGPRADTTSRLLDGLSQRGVQATFFVIGQQISANADLIQRMAADGHQIGNHTYSHVRLSSCEENTVIEEVQKTEVELENLLGKGDYWLRPPYGLIDEARAALIDTPMIYWSLDPEDWKLLDTDQVVSRVLKTVKSGDVVLLHDFYPTSVDAALRIIDTLQDQGYQFVTVRELFRLQGVTPQPGTLYASPTKIRTL
jgi:peptidoglycan/xylan/chitin deacetylase (PgdA/CDA1 family)